MWMVLQLLKYCEKRSALSVALIRMIFRSGLWTIRSFSTKRRKSLREGGGGGGGEIEGGMVEGGAREEEKERQG